jgi:hypothetical protein
LPREYADAETTPIRDIKVAGPTEIAPIAIKRK